MKLWPSYIYTAYMHAKSLHLCPKSLQPHGLQPTRPLCPWDSSGKNTGVGYHALLQGIFITQGSNPHVLCFLYWQASSLPQAPPGKPYRYTASPWIVTSTIIIRGVSTPVIHVYPWYSCTHAWEMEVPRVSYKVKTDQSLMRHTERLNF